MNQDFEQMEAETKERINALNVQIIPESENSDATDSKIQDFHVSKFVALNSVLLTRIMLFL